MLTILSAERFRVVRVGSECHFAIERPHRQHPAERQSARKTRRIFGDVRSGEAEAANRRYFHLVDVGICEGSVERKRQSGCRNDSCLQLNAPNSFIGRVDAYGLAGGIIGYALGAEEHTSEIQYLQRK